MDNVPPAVLEMIRNGMFSQERLRGFMRQQRKRPSDSESDNEPAAKFASVADNSKEQIDAFHMEVDDDGMGFERIRSECPNRKAELEATQKKMHAFYMEHIEKTAKEQQAHLDAKRKQAQESRMELDDDDMEIEQRLREREEVQAQLAAKRKKYEERKLRIAEYEAKNSNGGNGSA